MNRISRYEVRNTIAEGSTGSVLLAFDPVIERQVVIKTLDCAALPPGELIRTIGRFKREAIAAGRLTHPGIITVHDYGESGLLSFIAMEYAEGVTLREYLDKQPMPALEMLHAIARQLFAAMVYAHEQGVLHRDLKPGNVILVGDDADAASLQAKILDFGIARIDDAALGLTLHGTVVGTPGYMSPEQYQGKPVDARTDVYALAVMLFEMLTGQRTFQGSLAEVVQQVVESDAPLVSSIRRDFPADLDTVMARALRRDPAERYASMREFGEAFAGVMAPLTARDVGETVLDRPKSAIRKAADDAFTITMTIDTSDRVHPAQPSAAQLSAAMQVLRSATAVAGARAAPRPLVLFLDDEERILNTLSTLFRQNYEVLLASDGEQALEIVRSRRPHVVVSDQRMPGMPGVEFLRRARELHPASVRVLLTGYSDLAAIVGSINDGEIFRFVNKPWNNQDFKDTVAQAVEISLATGDALANPPAVSEASELFRATEAIVVAQKSRELFAIVNDGFGRTRPVCYAPDVSAVLRTVEDQEVAVLLCELDGFDGADVMLKMLKRSRPQIQTVAIAATSDSDNLISLINQAQIFRFMSRPLRLGLLDRALRSALSVYANCKARPVLQRRQSVEVKPAVAESSIGRQILRRLRLVAGPAAMS